MFGLEWRKPIMNDYPKHSCGFNYLYWNANYPQSGDLFRKNKTKQTNFHRHRYVKDWFKTANPIVNFDWVVTQVALHLT